MTAEVELPADLLGFQPPPRPLCQLEHKQRKLQVRHHLVGFEAVLTCSHVNMLAM